MARNSSPWKLTVRVQQFKPAWWCAGANAQTIVGALLRAKPCPLLTRQRIDTPDGDFLDLDFLEGKAPTVVILHGLEGSSKAPTVLSLLREIKKRGGRACAVNMRMCSGQPNRALATYHSGKTEDLDCVVRHLKEKRNHQKLYLVGFSIGGNIVLKWLGEQGALASGIVEKEVAVSVPYDLAKAVERMDRGLNRTLYTRSLLNSLKAKLRARKRFYAGTLRFERLKKCDTFRVFDREVTAPLNGFRDENDYWKQSSSLPFLKNIRVPTLLVHAEDDPFFPGDLLPYDEFRKSEYLRPLIVPAGGHLGFVTGAPWKGDRWLEKTTLDFLGLLP